MKTVHVAANFVQQFQSVCEVCGGKGKVISKKCGICGGKKIHDDLETLNVKLNRGIKNKEKITLSGSASDYVDQLASDLVFVVHRLEHKFYKVIGDFDLGITIKISLKEALLGFRRKIRLLDGTFITLEQKEVT